MDANARFKNERSQRGGKDMWKGRVGTSQEAESGIESDINSSMKWPMLLGCIMIVVLTTVKPCLVLSIISRLTSALFWSAVISSIIC